MCFEAFRDGSVDTQTIGEVLRDGIPSAFKEGTVTAALVALVLGLASVDLPLVAGAMVAAVGLAVVSHLTLLAAGVFVVRWRREPARVSVT